MAVGDMMATVPPVKAGSAKRLLFMYGTAPQGELNAMLDKNSVDTINLKADLRHAWRGAARHYRGLVEREAGAPDRIRTSKPTVEIAELVDGFSRSSAFQSTFAAHDVMIEEVELDLLVASQRSVDLDFVANLGEPGEAAERARLLLNPCRGAAELAVVSTGEGGYAFASNHPGALLAGSIEGPYTPSIGAKDVGGQIVHAVTLLIGFPIDTANAYRVGNRIILNNGFHRVFALRQAGVKVAPLA